MAMFPGIRAAFGGEQMNVGGLAIFLIIAFAIGQLTDTLAGYAVQGPMSYYGYAYRTNTVLWKNQHEFPSDQRQALIVAVDKDFNFAKSNFEFDYPGRCCCSEQCKDLIRRWRDVIGPMYARIHPNNLSDRLGAYSQYYSLNRNDVVTFSLIFIILAAIFVHPPYRQHNVPLAVRMTRVPRWAQPILLLTVLVAVVVSIERTSSFDRLFSHELFRFYLQTARSAGSG
jgi:hypothetical protein